MEYKRKRRTRPYAEATKNLWFLLPSFVSGAEITTKAG
jgi:hypothetical protein